MYSKFKDIFFSFIQLLLKLLLKLLLHLGQSIQWLGRPYHSSFYLSQILLGPFLNTLSHLLLNLFIEKVLMTKSSCRSLNRKERGCHVTVKEVFAKFAILS